MYTEKQKNFKKDVCLVDSRCKRNSCIFMSDNRPSTVAQNRIINTIQRRIDIGVPLVENGSEKYNTMVNRVNNYNILENRDNLEKVDNALDNFNVLRFIHPIESYRKHQIERLMPGERRLRFGYENSTHFGLMLTKADNIVQAALGKLGNDVFFNTYFKPKAPMGTTSCTSHRNKVRTVYNRISDLVRSSAPPIHNDDFKERCNVYAFVKPSDRTHTINLSAAYKNAPEVGTDSKPGVIVHETSHFSDIGGTFDFAYGDDIYNLWGWQAVRNADTYERAAEEA